ncbi:MAG: hypothetical protein K6T86_06025 [Pirellulales bacterium]|nr:hypothetical protein [Pirellulales bacterium]
MSECREQDDLLGATRETVVLAVRLLDQSLASAPRRIARALESEEFQRAIREALLTEAQRLLEMQQRGQEITNEDGLAPVARAGRKRRRGRAAALAGTGRGVK